MQKVKIIKARWLRVLFLLLAVTLAAAIFCMSNEPATESGARSSSIAVGILGLLRPDFDTLPEPEQEVILSAADHVLRKCTHFCIYAVLGALLFLYSLGFAARLPVHMLRALLCTALYAASDELHQAFIPGRGPAVTDVLLDSAGALCGILVAWLILWAILQRKQK